MTQVFLNFLLNRIREFLPYTLAGLISTGVNYGALYFFLGALSVATVIAVSAAFILSCGTNFFLQKFWAFGERELATMPRQMMLFLMASLLGLFVNDLVFWLFSDVAGVSVLLSQIPTTAAVSIIGILASRYIFALRLAPKAV